MITKGDCILLGSCCCKKFSYYCYYSKAVHYTPFHITHRSTLRTAPHYTPFPITHRSTLHTVPHYTPFHITHRSTLHTVPHYTPFHITHRSPLHTVPHYTPFHNTHRSILVGSYQDKMDTSDIVTSGACTKCHASQDTIKIYYTENLGSTKDDHCKSCPVPQVRNGNKNGCANCDAGYYYKVTGSNAGCDASLYDPANNIPTYITDATKCTTVDCEPCPKGKYSNDHLKPCQDCAEGTFTSETGKTACENCPEVCV